MKFTLDNGTARSLIAYCDAAALPEQLRGEKNPIKTVLRLTQVRDVTAETIKEYLNVVNEVIKESAEKTVGIASKDERNKINLEIETKHGILDKMKAEVELELSEEQANLLKDNLSRKMFEIFQGDGGRQACLALIKAFDLKDV